MSRRPGHPPPSAHTADQRGHDTALRAAHGFCCCQVHLLLHPWIRDEKGERRTRFPSMMEPRSPKPPSISAYENWGSQPDRLVLWPQPPPKRCDGKERRTSPLAVADATSTALLLALRAHTSLTARSAWRATGWGGRPALRCRWARVIRQANGIERRYSGRVRGIKVKLRWG